MKRKNVSSMSKASPDKSLKPRRSRRHSKPSSDIESPIACIPPNNRERTHCCIAFNRICTHRSNIIIMSREVHQQLISIPMYQHLPNDAEICRSCLRCIQRRIESDNGNGGGPVPVNARNAVHSRSSTSVVRTLQMQLTKSDRAQKDLSNTIEPLEVGIRVLEESNGSLQSQYDVLKQELERFRVQNISLQEQCSNLRGHIDVQATEQGILRRLFPRTFFGGKFRNA
jgi:hypothetical protein